MITVGSETLTRTLVSPSDYTLSISPTMPAPNTAATLTWTPANEPLAQYTAGFVGGPSTSFHANGDDTGTLDFPADTFPMTGDYALDFNRRVLSSDRTNVSGSPPNVQLARRFTISVR